MVALYGDERQSDYERTPERADDIVDDPFVDVPRLGQDIRLVLACVGGGAIQIGREVARHHLRHVETVAINCDASVQDREEFDRRICLNSGRSELSDIGGSPSHGAQIARAAASGPRAPVRRYHLCHGDRQLRRRGRDRGIALRA